MEAPYNKMPEANAPSTKYFSAASAARAESRCSAIMAYSDNDSSSKPIYAVKKCPALIITLMPTQANIASV